MSKPTPAQMKALRQMVDGGLDLSGIRSATIGALVGLGLIAVRHAEVSQTFRPSRAWSTTRWTRTRVALASVVLTPAGRALIATK
jgi:hypothetical protein